MVGIRAEVRHVDVLGLRTAVYRKGKGETIVLLHGSSPGACASLNWFRNFDYLADQGFDVLAFDQPGFGHTEAGNDASIDFRYRHAEALLHSLGIRSLTLVGNSMGGLLAVLLAHRMDPARIAVRRLVLAAPYPHFEMSDRIKEMTRAHAARLRGIEPTFESIKKLTSNTFFDASLATDDVVKLRLEMMSGERAAALAARREAGNAFDSESVRRQKVPTPTLIVWGMNDRSIPPDVGIQAMDHFEDARFWFLPRCGHWPQTEWAAHFNATAASFLREGARPA